MYQQCVKLGVRHPIQFLKSYLKICGHVFNTIDVSDRIRCPDHFNRPPRTIFTRPNFAKLSHCSAFSVRGMIGKWCEIIANAYDYEWFELHRLAIYKFASRKNLHNSSDTHIKVSFPKLEEFPSTECELEEFLEKLCSNSENLNAKVSSSFEQRKDESIIRNIHQFETILLHSKNPKSDPQCTSWQKSLSRKLVLAVVVFLSKTRNEYLQRKQNTSQASHGGQSVSSSREASQNSGEIPAMEEPVTRPSGILDLEGMEFALSETYFLLTLYKTFCSKFRFRNKSSDSSAAIIWKSEISRQYRMRNDSDPGYFVFSPIRLNIPDAALANPFSVPSVLPGNPSSSNPSIQNRVDPIIQRDFPDAKFPFSDLGVDLSQLFEKSIFDYGNTQFSFIVCLTVRVLCYLIDLTGIYPSSMTQFRSFLDNCSLTDRVALHNLHLTPRSFKESVNNTVKKYNALKFYKNGKIDYQMRKDLKLSDIRLSLVHAALHNRKYWDFSDKVNPNFKSLFFNSLEDTEQANSTLRTSHQNAHALYVKKGVITPQYIDATFDLLRERCEMIRAGQILPFRKKKG